MARYNKFLYGSQKYGPSVPDNLIWGLIVDWDDDGVYEGENEATWLKALYIKRGRNYLVSPSGDGFEPLAPGIMQLTLNNSDRRYDPYNENSPLYPNVDTGKFIKLIARVGANLYSVFTGTIQEIIPGENRVQINCEDGFRWLTEQELVSGVYENITADVAIQAILTASYWPWGSDLETGADQLDYWWMRGRNGNEEIRALAQSEFGRAFVAADGSMKFVNRFSNSVAVLDLDQSQVLRTITIPQPWEVRKNIVDVTSHPVAILAVDDIWTASTEYAVDGNSSIEITVEFDSPAKDVIQPVANTDYTAFDQTGGSGVDLTADISISVTAYAETAVMTITNNSASLAYLNLLKLRGNPLYSSAVRSRSTGTGYNTRPRQIVLDLEWQQDINNPVSFASEMLTFLSGIRELPVIQIESRPDIQYIPDLFDAVTLQIPAREISDTFQIGSIEHEWLSENGQAVRTTWRMEPIKEYLYWRFPVTFDTTSILG
jgi:hypothetical protein